MSASRSFRICVPEEWYRRSRSRSSSSASLAPSEDTVRRLEDLQESEDEGEEGDGTAKQKDLGLSTSEIEPGNSQVFTSPSDWRNSISQNRLSSIFESWIHPTATGTTNHVTSPEKKAVSEPKLVPQRPSSGPSAAVPSGTQAPQSDRDTVDSSEFEEMLVSSMFSHLNDTFHMTIFRIR